MQLLNDMDYLVHIEHRVQANTHLHQLDTHTTDIAKDIVADIERLPKGKKIVLPGGWDDNGGATLSISVQKCPPQPFYLTSNCSINLWF
jgi:hypothetical protein